MYYELLGGLVVASSVGVRDTHMATSICIYSAGRIILKPATSSFFAWGLSTGVRGGGDCSRWSMPGLFSVFVRKEMYCPARVLAALGVRDGCENSLVVLIGYSCVRP